MTPAARSRWRLGWLLLGFLGLIVLGFLPGQRSEDRPQPGAPPAVELQPGAWLDLLWTPDPPRLAVELEAGASVNQVLDDLGNTPLHLLLIGDACRDAQSLAAGTEALGLLIDAGAAVNRTDRRGNTPLMLAASRCPASLVSLLLDAGADLYAVNQRGLTAFEHVITEPRGVAELLLEAGFRLDQERVDRYLRVYADEPRVVQLIHRAAAR